MSTRDNNLFCLMKARGPCMLCPRKPHSDIIVKIAAFETVILYVSSFLHCICQNHYTHKYNTCSVLSDIELPGVPTVYCGLYRQTSGDREGERTQNAGVRTNQTFLLHTLTGL